MKTYILFFIGLTSLLFGAEAVQLSSKYKNSKKCMSCHSHIVKDWQHSWHAKSHYEKDEYFQKEINFIAKKTHTTSDVIEVQCAKCHNPRIGVTKVDKDYAIIASLGLDENSKVKKALKDDTIAEGINCLVCHNINKIKTNAPAHVRGMDRVEWNKNGLMSGPFHDANSPYHKTQKRDFFKKDPNKLCFVCHANEYSYANKKLQFTNMEKEYKGNQKCTECHMSPTVEKYAATYRQQDGTVKKRKIRYHKFIGAHTKSLWKDALKLKVKKAKKELYVTIENPQPHNIPSGFGGREILVEVVFFNGTKVLKKKHISLTTHYTRKHNKKSSPHLALSATKDMSIPAKGSKTIKLPLIPNANVVKVTLYYRLVNEEIHKVLKLKDPIWEEKFFITSKRVNL
jgi:hypothetical protein